MKKLSFLINTIIVSSLVFGCGNNKNNIKSENEAKAEKAIIDNSEVSIDTTKKNQCTMLTNETENKQDTLNKNAKYSNKENRIIKEAPKHNSPDQSIIDSIKKAKEKL